MAHGHGSWIMFDLAIILAHIKIVICNAACYERRKEEIRKNISNTVSSIAKYEVNIK